MNFETFLKQWIPDNSPVEVQDLCGVKVKVEGNTIKWLCFIDAPVRARYARYVECPKDKLPQVEGLTAGVYSGMRRPFHVIVTEMGDSQF